MTRILGLSNYLGHHHCETRPGCGSQRPERARRLRGSRREIPGRLPTFQVDRATPIPIARAACARAVVARQAKSRASVGWAARGLCVLCEPHVHETVRARWVVDAAAAPPCSRASSVTFGKTQSTRSTPSGAFLRVKIGQLRWRDVSPVCECLPNGAFLGDQSPHGSWLWCGSSRSRAAMSVRIVYARAFPTRRRCQSFRTVARSPAHASVGRDLRRSRSHRGRRARVLRTAGWRAGLRRWLGDVGDAAGFIDPLYSPGLDFCSYTTSYVADMWRRSRRRRCTERLAITTSSIRSCSALVSRPSTRIIFLHCDAELMSAALLLDVGSYFVGPLRPVYRHPSASFCACHSREFLAAPWPD